MKGSPARWREVPRSSADLALTDTHRLNRPPCDGPRGRPASPDSAAPGGIATMICVLRVILQPDSDTPWVPGSSSLGPACAPGVRRNSARRTSSRSACSIGAARASRTFTGSADTPGPGTICAHGESASSASSLASAPLRLAVGIPSGVLDHQRNKRHGTWKLIVPPAIRNPRSARRPPSRRRHAVEPGRQACPKAAAATDAAARSDQNLQPQRAENFTASRIS